MRCSNQTGFIFSKTHLLTAKKKKNSPYCCATIEYLITYFLCHIWVFNGNWSCLVFECLSGVQILDKFVATIGYVRKYIYKKKKELFIAAETISKSGVRCCPVIGSDVAFATFRSTARIYCQVNLKSVSYRSELKSNHISRATVCDFVYISHF